MKLGASTIIILVIICVVALIAAWETVTLVSSIVVWFAVPVAAFAMIKHFIIGWHQIKTSKAESQTAALETQSLQFDLQAKQGFAQAAIAQIQAGLIHPETLSNPKFKAFPSTVATQQLAAQLPQIAELPLLPALQQCDNILVVGGKGTGKTTLMQWIEAQRAANAKTIVLDSHARPSQWKGHIIGIGRQYEAIKDAMIGLTNKLKERYDSPEYANGTDSFEPINTFIDEFTLLPKALKTLDYNVQSYSLPALTEGRKVGINCVWGIHSDKVKAMGLEGASDIKECFDAIVYLKNVQGERYAICDFGEGKRKDVKYMHPGPFASSPQQPLQIAAQTDVIDQARPSIFDGIVTGNNGQSDEIKRAFEVKSAVENDEISWNKATQYVFGDGKRGSSYKQKLIKIWKQRN